MNTLKFGNGEWYGKEDTILAYNSENNNYKPLPFTFERASTATVVGKDGLIKTVGSNEPRIDYKDSTNGALLLEPSRTNLVTLSENFEGWSPVSNVTRTANYNESPQGVENATRLQFTANGYLGNNTQSSSTQYTLTCYAKRNDSGTQSVGFFTNGSGTVNSAWSLTSEWQRFTYTYTSTNTSYTGIAASSGADVSVYGFQMEEGSYATSYIKTEGSAVTRLADVCNNGGNDQVINSTEGVLYAEIKALANDSTNRLLSLNDGTASNSIWLYFNSSNNVSYSVRVGGVTQASGTHTIDMKVFNKIAIKYKENDFAVWFNGVQQLTDTSGSTYPSGTLNNISFDAGDGALDFYGNVKDVKLYNTALTDQELIALTT